MLNLHCVHRIICHHFQHLLVWESQSGLHHESLFWEVPRADCAKKWAGFSSEHKKPPSFESSQTKTSTTEQRRERNASCGADRFSCPIWSLWQFGTQCGGTATRIDAQVNYVTSKKWIQVEAGARGETEITEKKKQQAKIFQCFSSDAKWQVKTPAKTRNRTLVSMSLGLQADSCNFPQICPKTLLFFFLKSCLHTTVRKYPTTATCEAPILWEFVTKNGILGYPTAKDKSLTAWCNMPCGQKLASAAKSHLAWKLARFCWPFGFPNFSRTFHELVQESFFFFFFASLAFNWLISMLCGSQVTLLCRFILLTGDNIMLRICKMISWILRFHKNHSGEKSVL